MLGDTQERWLGDGLTAGFDWNLLGLGGLVMPFDRSAQKVPSNGYDNWTGYPDARERLVRMIGERGKNVVITGGASHMFFLGDRKSAVWGEIVSLRLYLGGRRILQKK